MGLGVEQKLSYPRIEKPGSAKFGAQMGVAELMFYGAVAKFESEASGSGIKAEAPIISDSKDVTAATEPATGKRAHMAIDISFVDTPPVTPEDKFLYVFRGIRSKANRLKLQQIWTDCNRLK
jgi:hypothetical protein